MSTDIGKRWRGSDDVSFRLKGTSTATTFRSGSPQNTHHLSQHDKSFFEHCVVLTHHITSVCLFRFTVKSLRGNISRGHVDHVVYASSCWRFPWFRLPVKRYDLSLTPRKCENIWITTEMDMDESWYPENLFGVPGPPGHRTYICWAMREVLWLYHHRQQIFLNWIIETVSSVIRGLLTKVCGETGCRTDSCRVSLGLIIQFLWN